MEHPADLRAYLKEQSISLNLVEDLLTVFSNSNTAEILRALPKGSFITITSLLHQRFDSVINIWEALGLMENDFTIETYYKCIPSPFREMALLYGKNTYQSISKDYTLPNDLELLKEYKYEIHLPILNSSNQRICYRRISLIHQISNSNELLSNINFHIPDSNLFKLPPITVPIISPDHTNQKLKELEDQVIKITVPQIRRYIDSSQKGKKKFLTETQEKIAILQSQGYNAKQIAELRHCERSTVNDHSKVILAKIQCLFGYEFSSSIEASKYMNRLRLFMGVNYLQS